jgi:ABC-type dipeptide/oligopeptide/nickel transport system permease component
MIEVPKMIATFLVIVIGLVLIATVIGAIAGIPAGIIDWAQGCPNGHWVLGWTP